MCGIAGIVMKGNKRPDKEAIRSMVISLAHRGPDEEGVWFYERAAFGHCRLSVIDTSQAGHQPMHYKHLTIAFNGEIYNYLEIKQELVGKGHVFRTRSDTEVILHAYEEWGEGCLQMFQGMWAFAILDMQHKIIFCARDRFGIKPFYYFDDSEKFIFASEIKAILSAGVPAQVDQNALMDYLVVGITDHSNNTFFKGIHQLLAGQYAIHNISTGEMHIRHYYDILHVTRQRMDGAEYVKRLQNSIRLHLRSDVPVGTCLSGGLDSSTVAVVAASAVRQNGGRPFGAFTAQSELPDNDESVSARQVAEHCSLDWHVVKPMYADFSREIEKCLYFQGEPVLGPSVFMQYSVMKAAKDAGFKVLLDGQGGDETLLGYERYYPVFLGSLFTQKKWLHFLKEYYLAIKHSRLTSFTLPAYFLYFLCLPLRKRALSQRAEFLKPEFLKPALNILNDATGDIFNIHELQVSEVMKYQMPHLLRYEDRNSMAHGIEARVPFVDHPCVEAALSLEHSEKIHNGYTKYVLRQFADTMLPKTITWRRYKIGFESPDTLWLSRHLSVMRDKVNHSELLHKICVKVPKLEDVSLSIQWKLYNVAVWEEQFGAQC